MYRLVDEVTSFQRQVNFSLPVQRILLLPRALLRPGSEKTGPGGASATKPKCPAVTCRL